MTAERSTCANCGKPMAVLDEGEVCVLLACECRERSAVLHRERLRYGIRFDAHHPPVATPSSPVPDSLPAPEEAP